MPMKLLGKLCCARLPMHIVDPLEIQKCEVLHAARMIEADVPPTIYERGHMVYCGEAVVMRVTAKGQAAARQSPAGGPLDGLLDSPLNGPANASPGSPAYPHRAG